MTAYDVCNGDADGLCALQQLRLAHPRPDAVLVTGLKRDIELLARVPAGAGDEVTVLDVSLERNRAALEGLLARGARVRYFDHHYAGDIPDHPRLETLIDTSGGLCTSTLVDRHLHGRQRAWAVAGAFGDGMEEAARALAAAARLDEAATAALRELGITINYNAYGESEADVLLHPRELYALMRRHRDPLALWREEPEIARLAAQREADLACAASTRPLRDGATAAAWLLPDAPWSRRVSGTFANRLARAEPQRAHAVITTQRGGYTVSVRAAGPRALELCREFPTGGGRVGAAGIDRLAPEALDGFLDAFARCFSPP